MITWKKIYKLAEHNYLCFSVLVSVLVCVLVCMYACIYVCMYVCVAILAQAVLVQTLPFLGSGLYRLWGGVQGQHRNGAAFSRIPSCSRDLFSGNV